MIWEVVDDHAALSRRAAGILLNALGTNPGIVLGLPTGRTPEEMYRHVVDTCRRDGHCFTAASTFNLDEYVGIPSDHPSSYCSYMRERLFRHVDLDPSHIHVPEGSAQSVLRRNPDLSKERALDQVCVEYEEAIRRAGGLDLTFLGLGTNGHIAFNEPGASFDSRTRVVTLSESTRRANSEFFVAEEVPRQAITMGIGTILESRKIVLLASGAKKRDAVSRLASGEVTEDFPVSALLRHPDVLVIVDAAAHGK